MKEYVTSKKMLSYLARYFTGENVSLNESVASLEAWNASLNEQDRDLPSQRAWYRWYFSEYASALRRSQSVRCPFLNRERV